LGGWYEPESGLLIAKDLVVTESDSDYLIYFHDQMHIYWKKLSEGYSFEWTFLEVFNKHTEIIREMAKRGIQHLFPINNLDNILISHAPKIKEKKENEKKLVTLQKEKVYLIEKKIKGLHIQAHKKGSDVKIFSEEKKDITNDFSILIEEIKNLSDKDFIIDGGLVTNDDSSINLYVWDMPYFEKDITEMPLSERIKEIKNLNFSDNIKEIERKISNGGIEELRTNIEWASNLPNSEGAITKDLSSKYEFGENYSYKKYNPLKDIKGDNVVK